MMKKTALFFLIFALLFVFLASCSSLPQDSAFITAAVETEPEITDSLEARKLVSDNLPDVNYGGGDFVIVTENSKEKYFVIEELTGDLLDDGVYNRNMAVEERFGIKLKADLRGEYDSVRAYIQKTVLAADDAFDLISYHVVSAGGLVTNNLLLNWHDVPYVDFSRPWWSSSTVNDLTHNGVAFLAVGDAAITALTTTYCMYYNKNFAESYNWGDMYDIVNSGRWTIDKMETLVKDIYEDLDGDGKRGQSDFYGYAMPNGSAVNTFLWSFNNPIFKKNTEGGLEYVYKSEKINDIITRIHNLLNNNLGVYCETKTNNAGYSFTMYKNSLIILTTGTFGNALSWRDVETDFGIIPYPKWNESQDKYYTMSDGSHSVLALPYSIIDSDYSGIITEALCAQSWKDIMPNYYDVALKIKGARDEESVAMLDMIFMNRIFDFGYVYDNFKGVSFYLQWLINDNNTNFESYYAKSSKGSIKHYEKVIAAFEDYL